MPGAGTPADMDHIGTSQHTAPPQGPLSEPPESSDDEQDPLFCVEAVWDSES